MRRIVPTLALAASLALVAAAPPGHTEADQTFYLRGEGCGATESPYLSITSGADGLDGCGGIGGLPFNEVFHQAGVDGTTAFAAIDGLPIVLDGTRNLTGQIRTEQWFSGTVSAGQIIIEGAVIGRQGSKSLTLGTFSHEHTKVDAATGHDFQLDIDLDDAISFEEFTGITVEVAVRGLNQNNSNLGLEGDSFITLPILELDEDDEGATG